MQWILILILILILGVTLFAIENVAIISISYLFGQANVSLALVIVVSVIVGAVLGILASLQSIWKVKAQLRGQKKELNDLKKEIQESKETEPEVTD
ncbi:LapA family protein [Candidatus Oleimmundimicrobium sp.]|uniref:LapA family protein n=1 Tax=Candidatus Oleimmundimicrobium sp. TaxID=3060597 RepID=UPI002720CADA|nr:LapA family protein [Candidatus Oleimmundimicrobium sp.]MDO8886720.1 LapA family protein [Candidatus Oleimmundimicrobium sp.]